MVSMPSMVGSRARRRRSRERGVIARAHPPRFRGVGRSATRRGGASRIAAPALTGAYRRAHVIERLPRPRARGATDRRARRRAAADPASRSRASPTSCARRCPSTRSSWPPPTRTRCSGSAPASPHGMPAHGVRAVLGVRVRGPRLQQVHRPRARPAAGRRPARRDRRAARAQRALARAADADGRRRGAARHVQRRRPRLGAAAPQPRRDGARLPRRGGRVRRDDRARSSAVRCGSR